MLNRLVSVALFGLCMAAGDAMSQDQPASAGNDVKRILEALPRHLATRLRNYEQVIAASLGNSGAASQVIDQQRKWRPGNFPLRVCFFPGKTSVMLKITKFAKEWEDKQTSVAFNFGIYPNFNRCEDGTRYQVRIDFEPTGYWSLVGRDSIEIADQGEQSMNFGRWGSPGNFVSEQEMRATVLHEFGHALGLHHAHQHPWSTCEDDFDFDLIYPYMAGEPNFWRQEKVDFNMRALHPSDVATTAFDPQSIMKYFFPKKFYKNETESGCYSEENLMLSPKDRSVIAALYPANAVDLAGAATARLGTAINALNDVAPTKTRFRDKILQRLFAGQPLLSTTADEFISKMRETRSLFRDPTGSSARERF